MTRLTAFAWILMVACTSSLGDDVETQPQYPRAVQKDSIVFQLGSETVRFLVEDSTRHIVWNGIDRVLWTSSTADGETTRWWSHPLQGIVPTVRLLPVDEDSVPDLFWTYRHEEMRDGALLLAAGDTFSVAYSLAEGCSVPQLADVTGDGLLDILEYGRYVLRDLECFPGDIPWNCLAGYPTEWVRVLVQKDGQFVEDFDTASAFYRSLALDYAQAATELEAKIPGLRSNETKDGVSSICADVATEATIGLREMAERASAIANRSSYH